MFDSQQSGEIASFSMIFGPEKSRQPHFQMSFLGIPGMPSGQVGSELSISAAVVQEAARLDCPLSEV